MAAVTSGSVDVDRPGKYPIVLSDALLLGKPTKELYTGIRCMRTLISRMPIVLTAFTDNHKADPSSDSAIRSLQLQPSSDSDPTSYDLSFSDNSEKYSYNGTRTSGDGEYVLIFDPDKKCFVLHRIDSTFNMNLVGAPWNEDESNLRSQYPQLEAPTKPQISAPQRKSSKSTKGASSAKVEAKRRKTEKAKKPKPAREPTPEEEESDDCLTVEYPDGPPAQQYQYNSTPVFQRNVSEEVSDEDSDAEHEEYEEEHNQDVDLLKLPSPANHNAGGLSDEDIELDLEAELEQALKEEAGTGADESSESEEE
jgi:hypothetical protein